MVDERPQARRRQHSHPGDDPMAAPAQPLERSLCLGRVTGLAQERTAMGDHGISGDDHGAPMFGGDRPCLRHCEPPRHAFRPPAHDAFFDLRLDHVERDAEATQKLAAARRAGGEDQPRASVATHSMW